jgi:hypothetical protein
LTAPREEAVPALKLDNRRRLLGYLVPLMNLPLFIFKAYEVYVAISTGTPWNTPDFLNDLILLTMSLGINFYVTGFVPVYTSSYALTGTGLKISRFMRRTTTLPYAEIARTELYIRDEKRGKPSKEAIKTVKDSINELRQAGFKFADHTNAEESIALLFCESKVYMISPAYPKAFANKLRRRVGSLPVRIVELTPRGKRTKDLTQ